VPKVSAKPTPDNTGLVFGDAKKSLNSILNEAKEL